MSILITGVEMPNNGELLCINIHPNGKVCYGLDLNCEQIATATPVPPHGRLIDADALESDDPDVCNSFMRDGYTESCEWGYSHEQISNAPTVIPGDHDG